MDTKIGQISTIAAGRPVLEFGFKLMRMKNKNEVQERAARSFSRYFRITCILVAVMTVVLCTVIGIAVGGTWHYDISGVKRYGRVTGDMVNYTQNVRKSVSLAELGLADMGLAEGDRVLLFFDHATDELNGAVPQSLYDQKVEAGVILAGVTIAVSIVLMCVWGIVGQSTVGLDFGEYYAISRRRNDGGKWAGDARSGLYEQVFISSFRDRRNIWPRFLLLFITLGFLIGVSMAGTLAFSRVYAFMPDKGLVTFTRFVGLASVLFYVLSFVYIVNTYDYRMHPLYFSEKQLRGTCFLTVKAGKAGYYTQSGEWREMKRAKILQEDGRIMRVKCYYEGWLSDHNYFAKGDEAYDAVKKLAGSGTRPRRTTIYAVGICVIALLYILLAGANLYLAVARDQNTISFSACHDGNFDL